MQQPASIFGQLRNRRLIGVALVLLGLLCTAAALMVSQLGGPQEALTKATQVGNDTLSRMLGRHPPPFGLTKKNKVLPGKSSMKTSKSSTKASSPSTKALPSPAPPRAYPMAAPAKNLRRLAVEFFKNKFNKTKSKGGAQSSKMSQQKRVAAK